MSKRITIFLGSLFIYLLFFSTSAFAQVTSACQADINLDGIVDVSDYSILAVNFLKTSGFSNQRADINNDGLVDVTDFSAIAANYSKAANCPTTTPTQTTTPTVVPATTGEWTQFGHNQQLTNYTLQSVATPWKYMWQWNGAGADGKKQANHLSVPNLVQPITGGGRIYMVAADQVFALDKNTGAVIWTKSSIGTLQATGVYDNENLYIPSGDGRIYKLNAQTGATLGTFTGNSAFNISITFSNGNILAGSVSGTLYSIKANTMQQEWAYAAGSALVSPPAYSASKNTVIVYSKDLYVHAVNGTTGAKIWKVKPTSRVYQAGNPNALGAQLDGGWPVIAEQHGIVFVRYRLDWDTLWTWNPYPTTNAAIRSGLVSTPSAQALYALKISDGTQAFVPAVGNGGAGDGGTLPMGPQPVIRVVNGSEVAYVIFRNGLTCGGCPTGGTCGTQWCDGREDAAMGEMVLDNTTIPGYQAGDMRFIRFTDIQTDEMLNITMSNDILFHSHWLINSAEKITDRNDTLGATFTNPIKTTDAPFVIWRQVYCPPTNTNCNPQLFPGGTTTSYGPSNCTFDTLRRYCSAGLYSYGDQRGYPAGFYQYFNDSNGGSTAFTIVSANQVLVKTYDGGLIVLQNGNPLADVGVSNKSITQNSEPSNVLGVETTATPVINPKDASKYINTGVIVKGTIATVIDHLPKAVYISFSQNHNDTLLVRVFQQDVSKFGYDLETLKGKEVEIKGFITFYWPEGKYPELVVTDPNQITVIK